MDIVLGVSMAPDSVQMVLVEGENADGALVEDDEFDVIATDDAATITATDQVISAILGTREGAADAGLQLSSIGVTWTDPVEAAVLRDALSAYKLENVMLVSAFLAATALGQSVGGAMGYDRTAVLFVEPETATLAVVETADGSITEFFKEQIDDASSDEATAQLTGLLAELEQTAPGGVFLVGSGVDVASIKPALESATSLSVSASEEPQTALARGAALASANAPLFASSTAALAYAQDTGTGVVDPYALPDYLNVLGGRAVTPGGELSADDLLAYSALPDDDADAATVLMERPQFGELQQSQPQRRSGLLIGSGLAVVGISAVVALEIALAIGIRTTVALQPSPSQSLIVPAQLAPAPVPVEASAPRPKISLPAPIAAPRALNPMPAAELPAAPLPAAPVVPVPVLAPPVMPVPAPGIHMPIPEQFLSPPMGQAPMRLSPPQQIMDQPPVHVPQQPFHQTAPNEGMFPGPSRGGGHGFGGGGEPGTSGPFGGGGHEPSVGGPFGGGGEPGSSGPFGGGGHEPFGGGPVGGGPFGGGGHEPFGGGPFGGGGGGPFGGGEHGPFGGGGGPFGGGGLFGGGGEGPFGGGGHGGFGGGGGWWRRRLRRGRWSLRRWRWGRSRRRRTSLTVCRPLDVARCRKPARAPAAPRPCRPIARKIARQGEHKGGLKPCRRYAATGRFPSFRSFVGLATD